MEETIKEQIYCGEIDKKCYVEFEFKEGQVWWTKFKCEYIDKKKRNGQCYRKGGLCNIVVEFHEHVKLIDSLSPPKIIR